MTLDWNIQLWIFGYPDIVGYHNMFTLKYLCPKSVRPFSLQVVFITVTCEINHSGKELVIEIKIYDIKYVKISFWRTWVLPKEKY